MFLIFFTGRPNFEEGGPTSVGRKHEFIRSESDNWRIFREEQNGEDEDGGWRLAGSRRDGERWRPHSPGKNSVEDLVEIVRELVEKINWFKKKWSHYLCHHTLF